MAKNWIKMRVDVHESIEFFQVMQETGLSESDLLFALYRLISWISVHGKYGNLKERHLPAVDTLFGDRLVGALICVDWLRKESGWAMFRGFTKAHEERKSIGRKLRKAVFAKSGDACCHCESTDDLEVDHDIPIARGGTSDLENLICLCRRCNRRKWKKTYREFVESEAENDQT